MKTEADAGGNCHRRQRLKKRSFNRPGRGMEEDSFSFDISSDFDIMGEQQ